MRRPALDIFQTFNQVGLAVKRATGGVQQPWVSSSPIDGSFYFVPPPSNHDTLALASTPASSAPLPDTQQFDGIWKGMLVCESASPGGPGWKYELIAVVKDGAFRSQRGAGPRGSETFEGMIEPDGTAQIVQHGTSGETKNDPLHRPPGTPFRNTYIGTFDGSRATLARSDRFSCMVNFAKQDRPLVGSLASPSAKSDAGPQAGAPPVQQRPNELPSADQPSKGQRSALLESESPGPSGAPQAEGLFTEQDMQRVNAIAARDELAAMPKFRIERPDSKLPAGLRKFVGVWASDIGFARGNGRHAMLIVTEVAAQGRASGYYVLGSPTARSLYKTAATAQPFEGKITGDQLSFQEDKFDVTATIAIAGSLAIVQKQKDGTALNVTVNPVWRLLDAERSAKR
jgi:hypothetical protein